MSTVYVDTINEKTSGNGVQIPGHVIQTVYVESTTSAVYHMGGTTTSTDLYLSLIHI